MSHFLTDYLLHVGFEGVASAGGYYARGYCRHTWHRVTLAIVWTLVTTAALVALIG